MFWSWEFNLSRQLRQEGTGMIIPVTNPKTTLGRWKCIVPPENPEQFLTCTDASDSLSTHLRWYTRLKINLSQSLVAAAFHRPMEEEEQPRTGRYFVGKKDELIKAKRTVATVGGRDILVIHHQGVFYALDCYCYRKKKKSDISYKCHMTKSECSRPFISQKSKVILATLTSALSPQILGETWKMATLRWVQKTLGVAPV